MTTIGREILEPFSGVIGSSWKDISYTKTCPTQFHDAKTPRYFSHVLYACHSIHCLQLVHSLSATVGSKKSPPSWWSEAFWGSQNITSLPLKTR